MCHRLVWSLFLVFALTGQAHACSCGKRTLEQQFSEAGNVFVGRVASTSEISSRASDPDRGGVAATFTLVKDLKGNTTPSLKVQSGYGSGDCGIPLLVGTSYLFFVSKDAEINICSGTQVFVPGYEPHDRLLKRLERLTSPPK